MPGEQNFKVNLSFKDDATGKFVKATEEQIAAIKKLGIAVKKEGSGVGLDLERMGKKAEESGRGYRFLGGEITGVMKSLGSLRNMILVYLFALRPLVNLTRESIEAFSQQEDATRRINYAMGLQGTYSERMSKNLIALSENFQNTTRYGDDLVLNVMEKLVTLGRVMPSELENVTRAVLDFAAATGKDPVDAAELFARASQGITTGLKRAGIIIDEFTPKSRVLAATIEEVNSRMGGRAQKDIDSYTGRLKRFENAVSDLRETIGLLIIEGLNLPYVLQTWTQMIGSLNKAITGFEGTTPLDVLHKRLADINKKISESGAEAISKQTPNKLWFITGGYSEKEIEKAKSLIMEKTILLKTIEKEKQDEFNKRIAEEAAANAEHEKQLKLDAQEDFMTQYNSLESRRLDIARQAYEEDKKRFEEAGVDKVKLAQWNSEKLKELAEMQTKVIKSEYDKMVDITKTAAIGMRDAMKNIFIGTIKGEMDSLKDAVVGFGDMMLNKLMEIAATMAMTAIFPWSKPFLGIVHSGGSIYSDSPSYGIPRKKFHSGGEVPATLLEGEYVMNRNAVRNIGVDNLDKLNRGERMGGGTVNNYYIQTIDERSFRERLQQHGDIYASTVEKGYMDNTSLRKTAQRYGG